MAGNDRWDAIEQFQRVLSTNGSGAEISLAIQDYGQRVITPLITRVTSLDELDKELDFFRTHLGHATGSSRHPDWARDHYPVEVIRYAEDSLFDSELFPLAFPDRGSHGGDLPEKVRLSYLSSFPRLISDYLRISPAAFKRIMGGTSEIHRAVAVAQASGKSPKRLVDDLEQISGRYNDESGRENQAKYKRITSGMDTIAAENTPRLMRGVQFSNQYRARLRLLEERLAKATEDFNRHASSYDDVRNDFQRQWTNYVIGEVRKLFLTDVFDRAYVTQETAQVTPQKRSLLSVIGL